VDATRAALRRRFAALLLTLAGALCAFTAAAIESAAFYYGANPPWDELAAFDLVVVEPGHTKTPPRLTGGKTRLLAYLGVGEVNRTRSYFADIPVAWRLGTNPGWEDNTVIDQAQPGWPAFLVEHAVKPLWDAGYRGFFLDTLDSYELFAKTPEQRAAQVEGLLRVVRAIKARYPNAELVLNRGFELLPQIAPHVLAVAAESVFEGWDAQAKRYRPVPDDWRTALLAELARVKNDYRLPVIAIDYVPPESRPRAREVAERLRGLGFVPWVANAELDALGVGTIEVMPRKILMLHAGTRDEYALETTLVARYASMPLQWLGYVPVYRDVEREPLPATPLAGRYAGIVTWFQGELGPGRLVTAELLRRALRERVPVAALGRFGFPGDAALAALYALESPRARRATPASVRLERRLPRAEIEPIADRREFVQLSAPGAEVLLRVVSDRNETMDAVAVTPWGGYALDPYLLVPLPGERGARWAIEPIEFLRRALVLPEMPVPDVTTESGRRLLLAHIDGDGFASRAEFARDWSDRDIAAQPGAVPPTPLAAEVLLRHVLRRNRVPITMSVIQGELAANGLYPQLSAALERIARHMFALPHVEIASHSFSHPFQWQAVAQSGDARGYALAIPDYRFDLQREIDGSVRYIEERLAPAGKRVKLFLWTGDCNPGNDAVARTAAAGIGNMNGGDTIITRAQPSLTRIGPLGLPKGTHFQVYAPNQNENLYTNGFRGPFNGYKRVIETFELTEAPRRFKPINIYVHTYSATKRASLEAVNAVFDWALSQHPQPIHASEYVAKVLDFNRLVLAKAPEGYRVRSEGAVRTLRLPARGGFPDLERSRGVAGFADHAGERYLHLASGEASIALAATPPVQPYLESANARVSAFERSATLTRITLQGHVPIALRLAHAEGCVVRAGEATVAPAAREGTTAVFHSSADGPTRIAIDCRR
jgi:uncharacterized protein (TIGR01370 family)